MTISLGQTSTNRAVIHFYPDIQNTSQFRPFYLHKMVDCSLSRVPDLVLVAGDITNNNDVPTWVKAKSELDRLTAGGIKWILCTGNHDTDVNRSTLLNNYFSAQSWITGLYQAGHLENSYSIVTMGGSSWLVLSLEFGPRTAVVAWAHSILSTFADLPAILLTHAYLYLDGNRYDYDAYGDTQGGTPRGYNYTAGQGMADGQDLLDSLVSIHKNILLVLCGHNFDPVPGYAQSRRVDTRLGTKCTQILQNFQELDCGSGILSELGLDSINNFIYHRSFNTLIGNPRIDVASEFYLPLR